MPKAKAKKATKIQLRLQPTQKAMLARAAELRETSLTHFVLEHACQAAEEVLAEQADMVMSPAQWSAFCDALDAPPRVIPPLKALFSEGSVFDKPRKAAR